jgi:transcriptional regulator with XRE-family HTH domain
MRSPLINYLRAQRKRAGLSQNDLAFLLGYTSPDAISKHELFESVPPLMMAFGYQTIFRVPLSDLFAGLREAVELSIEKQFAEFEHQVLEEVRKSRNAQPSIALLHKLEWIKEHRRTAPR